MMLLAASAWVLGENQPGGFFPEKARAFSWRLVSGLMITGLWSLWMGLARPPRSALSAALSARLSPARFALSFERLGLPPFKPLRRAALALRASAIMRLE
jgi:hypothetical protein